MKLTKYFVLLGVFFLFVGVIQGYIQYNLARYSVYYASHMPRKKGTKPELIIALENINWIDKPNTENVRFDEIYDRLIYVKESTYFTYSIEEDGNSYYLGINKIDGVHFYNANSAGKFVTYSSLDNREKRPLDKKSLQEVENRIALGNKDLIQAQKTPTINLQTLFNQKYGSRFNE